MTKNAKAIYERFERKVIMLQKLAHRDPIRQGREATKFEISCAGILNRTPEELQLIKELSHALLAFDTRVIKSYYDKKGEEL